MLKRVLLLTVILFIILPFVYGGNIGIEYYDNQYYTKTEIQNDYVVKEDLEDMVGLSYDDSIGILTLTININ